MKSILFVFEVCSCFLLLLQNVDGKLSLRTILKESDTLSKRMSKADETIRNLKKFAQLTSSSEIVNEREIGQVLKRNIEQESTELPFFEEVFNYIHLRSEDETFKQLQNKIKRAVKMVKSKVKDVVTALDSSKAVVKKKFKFKENYKKPKRMIKKKKRTIENSFWDSIIKTINNILMPGCEGSKSEEKNLRRIAKRINKDKKPIIQAVQEIEHLTEFLPQSIEQIIRDLESSKINEIYSNFESKPFLLNIKVLLQHFSDSLYQFLAFLSTNDLYENVLPGIKGILNVHTAVIRFLIIKLFCLIDSFGIEAIGEPLKDAILKLLNMSDLDDEVIEKIDDLEIDNNVEIENEEVENEEIDNEEMNDVVKKRSKTKKNKKGNKLKLKRHKILPIIKHKIKQKREAGKKRH